MKLLSGILLLLFLIACGAEIDSELEQMVPPPPPPPLPGSPIETGSAGFFGKAVPTWAPWASDNKGGVLSPLTNLEEFDKNSQLALTLSDYDFIYSTGYASDTDYILNTPGALDPFRVWLVYNFIDKTGTLTT